MSWLLTSLLTPVEDAGPTRPLGERGPWQALLAEILGHWGEGGLDYDDNTALLADYADRPGVLRIGPPAGCVGPYAIVAHPDGDRLFVSNLHVPFLTVVDATTGAWADSIDLQDAGAVQAQLPRLYLEDRVLWVSDFEAGLFWRFDVDDYRPLDPVVLGGEISAARATADGLWVGLEDGTLVQLVDGVETRRLAGPWRADALDVTTAGIAVVNNDEDQAAVLNATNGRVAWFADLGEGRAEDVLWVGDEVWVSDRETGDVIRFIRGAEVERVHTGSDTFSLTLDTTQAEDRVLVVNRQGAELPAVGTYTGAPSLLTALDLDMDVDWVVEIGKTAHFPAWDGSAWWIVNEDSLDLSAVDPAGYERLRGPKIGLSLDHIAEDDGGDLWMGSHLTDEVWRVNDTDAHALPTCGWPFVTVLVDGQAWLPCQQDGDVQVFDVETEEVVALHDVTETFHTPCEDGLCTSHVEFVDATWADDQLVWSDPYVAGVRWMDGTVATWDNRGRPGTSPLHLGVLADAGNVYAYDPRGARILRAVDGVFDEEVSVTGTTHAFPILAGDRGLWSSAALFDDDLDPVATLPEGTTVVATGQNWLVTTDGDELVVYWEHNLTERGRLPLADLRVPPLGHRGDELGAMRYLIGRDDALIIVNSFRGTVERRTLPDLVALGNDEITALGSWSSLPGVR